MIKKFEKGKSYVCRADLIAADPIMTASDLGSWMVELDGQPVEEILSETNAAIGGYRLDPWWCDEVEG